MTNTNPSNRRDRPVLKFTAVIFTAAIAASITAGLVVRQPDKFDPIVTTRAANGQAPSSAIETGTGSQVLPDFGYDASTTKFFIGRPAFQKRQSRLREMSGLPAVAGESPEHAPRSCELRA